MSLVMLSSVYNFSQKFLNFSEFRVILRHGNTKIFRRSSSEAITGKRLIENDTVDEAEQDEMKIRNKSRVPSYVRDLMADPKLCKMPEVLFDYQITKKYKRKLYAKFGRESGIDPSIIWPTKDEIRERIEFEKEFEPPLQERIDKVVANKQENLRKLREREEMVERNMKSLDKWMKELQARKDKKMAEVLAVKEKKERLIEEVRQFFGYKLSPKDPKFQEAILKKEQEERKALKAKRKEEKYAREMAKLQAMASIATKEDDSKK